MEPNAWLLNSFELGAAHSTQFHTQKGMLEMQQETEKLTENDGPVNLKNKFTYCISFEIIINANIFIK